MHEHAVGEGGVEDAVRERQLVDARHLEARVRAVARAGTRLLDQRGLRVDAERFAWRNQRGEAQRDRSWTAAGVEQAHSRTQMPEEEGRMTRRGTHGKLRLECGVALLRIGLD